MKTLGVDPILWTVSLRCFLHGMYQLELDLPVFHCEPRLGVLGGHTDQAGDPHPEQGPRAAGRDGRRGNEGSGAHGFTSARWARGS